jgi:hypothetical protein
MTFARAFTNGQDSSAYENAFRKLFSLMQDQCQVRLKWQHLHGEGFQAITTDMDKGQLKVKYALYPLSMH